MISAYWNALRVEDEVFVHDDSDRDFAIAAGTVAFVGSRPGSNDVTVRLAGVHGPGPLVRPKRLAVHLARPGARTDCWRCSYRA
jgi:hypothetical protein